MCETTSGATSIILSIFSVSPLKSGISVSIVVLGFKSLTALTVSAHIIEPPSFKSSLSTEVKTACLTPIILIDLATLNGSNSSAGKGLPVWTLQKPQDLVHIFPRIINVAVPSVQHSPILGQFPETQIV